MKKRKKPKLLPVLAFTATAGAAVFLTSLTPFCRPRPDGAEAAQRRAFAAAARAVTEETARAGAADAAAAVEADEAAIKGFAEAARVKASQREFWITQIHPEMGGPDPLVELALKYVTNQAHWDRELLSGRANKSPNGLRRELDLACQDLTKLSPEARKKWDEWEAKNWTGFPLRTVDPYSYWLGIPAPGTMAG